MENTTAFSTLMDLISILGSFVTTPLFFGLSVLNILVLTFVFNMVIGLLLGGISPRSSLFHYHPSSSGKVTQVKTEKGAIETYKGGGSY